jgi:effector-binding domain-containing protein
MGSENRTHCDQSRELCASFSLDSEARKRITEIYEDLAKHASFKGILFHDDAFLTDFEDASPEALAAYRAAGLPGSIEQIRNNLKPSNAGRA